MANQTRQRFGTFGGVFTPCVLMILGVILYILYLHLGYVTGQAGLWHCLLIIAFAQGTTGLTALSLSSTAVGRGRHRLDRPAATVGATPGGAGARGSNSSLSACPRLS